MPVGCLMLPRFAAEVQALRPDKSGRGRAIAVHQRGRIVACSRQAEEAGLTAHMPLGQAQAVCPRAEFIAYVEDHYHPHHHQVLDICATHASAVEPIALDEIFLDLDIGPPEQIMAEVADAVSRVGFTCRTGAAPGKLVARITACVRPGAGVAAGKEGAFLASLPVSRLWMLDDDTVEHLQALGIHTIGLLQQTPLSQLTLRFGRMARRLSELAFGQDATPVRPLYPPQVVEAEIALLDGAEEAAAIETRLRQLAARIAAQLAARRRSCGSLAMEIETDDGRTLSRSLRLAAGAHTEDDLLRAAQRIFARVAVAAPITGLALRAGDLRRCEGVQRDLFGADDLAERKCERLDIALTTTRQHFGSQAVLRAGELEVPRRERMLTFYM